MPEEAPQAPNRRRRRAPLDYAAVARLIKKYNLDAVTYVKDEGLGRGPILGQEVIEKFASLDQTTSKKYLDWMFYQAGGGSVRFQRGAELWGVESEDVPATDIINTYEREIKNNFDVTALTDFINKTKESGAAYAPYLKNLLPHAPQIVSLLNQQPNDRQKFLVLSQYLKQHNLIPPKIDPVTREQKDMSNSVAVIIVDRKFRAFANTQRHVKVKDRARAVMVNRRMIRGEPVEQAEEEWNRIKDSSQREYLFGDQDSFNMNLFGFARHWPGKKISGAPQGLYEKIYTEMAQFLANKQKIEARNLDLDRYNQAIELKNQSLPPERQVSLREKIKADFNIGTVVVEGEGMLVYRGAYPTIGDLMSANEQLKFVGVRERIMADVRFAGPKGRVGRGEKLYEDENVIVMVPLTVAASIKSGFEKWCNSSPGNIEACLRSSDSDWVKHTQGKHKIIGRTGDSAVMIHFTFKQKLTVPWLQNIGAMFFVPDLPDLEPPFSGATWTDRSGLTNFNEVVNRLPAGAKESFEKACQAIIEWGKEFDPRAIVSDFMQHHSGAKTTRRGLREALLVGAFVAIEQLVDD